MALKNVTGSITITDQNGTQHTINSNELDFQEVERHQRQMGNEVMYSAEVGDDDWSVTVEVWEYPLGSYSHDNISVEDGHYDGGFNYTFEA